VASKLTSRFVSQARRLPFSLVAAASISLPLQLQSDYAENPRDQITLDSKTHAVQNSISDAINVTPTIDELTVNDAAGVKTLNLGTASGSELGASAATTGTTTRPVLDKGSEVDVKAYGAVGDGVTNDTAAFNAALTSLTAAGGGVCLVPKGTYIISAAGITAPLVPGVSSGVHLVGEGRGASILKVNGMPTNHLLQCDGDNWSVENLTFDMQDYFTRGGLSAITCKGSNWRVANCAVIKIGRFGISAFGGDNWSIEGNYISKTKATGTYGNQSILVSSARVGAIYATNARIIDNVCEGSGIIFWGNNSVIARNRISGAGFGSGICTGRSEHADALHVTGNICSGGRGFDMNRTWVSGFELWAPNSVIAKNTAYDNDGTGIIVGGQNCVVIGNQSYNNGVGAGGFVFGARYLSPVNNASGSIFIGNSAHDTHPRSSMTQAYGYAEQPGGLHHITQIGNDYNPNKMGPTKYNSSFGQPKRISPAMKNKLQALTDAKDTGMSDIARRALREYLERVE